MAPGRPFLYETTREFLIAFGLLSAAVAVPFVLVQHDVKRLLETVPATPGVPALGPACAGVTSGGCGDSFVRHGRT